MWQWETIETLVGQWALSHYLWFDNYFVIFWINLPQNLQTSMASNFTSSNIASKWKHPILKTTSVGWLPLSSQLNIGESVKQGLHLLVKRWRWKIKIIRANLDGSQCKIDKSWRTSCKSSKLKEVAQEFNAVQEVDNVPEFIVKCFAVKFFKIKKD